MTETGELSRGEVPVVAFLVLGGCAHKAVVSLANTAEVFTIPELPGESTPDACQVFQTDLSDKVFPRADGHRYEPEGHVYRFELDGAQQVVQCLMKEGCEPAALDQGGDEVCVDHSRCCLAGVD